MQSCHIQLAICPVILHNIIHNNNSTKWMYALIFYVCGVYYTSVLISAKESKLKLVVAGIFLIILLGNQAVFL